VNNDELLPAQKQLLESFLAILPTNMIVNADKEGKL